MSYKFMVSAQFFYPVCFYINSGFWQGRRVALATQPVQVSKTTLLRTANNPRQGR
jgi:hypothetical protein